MAFGMMSSTSKADQYEQAARKSGEAFYITSGTKAEVDNMFKVVEERYIPKVVKEYGPVTGYIGQMIIDKRITIKFNF
jgi:hypothetical protein